MSAEVTTAEAQEKQKLRKHFGRFDMFFFLICTLVGLDTLGAVSSVGPQAFTWLAVLGLFFFVPYALLTAELGSSFPAEGGAYIWVRLAFGRLAAAVTSVFYWLSNPIWLGGSLTILAMTTFSEFFVNLDHHSDLWKYLFGIAFVWFAVWSSILSFGIGKWVSTIGGWVRIVLLGFFTVSVVVYAVDHGVHGVGASGFSPTWGVFAAAVPVLLFNYVGFELPSAAGDEMKDAKRDVPVTVTRAAIGALLLYGLPILAILLVLPQAQVTSVGGFIDAMKTVFTVYGGHVDLGADGTVTATLTGVGRVLGDFAAVGFMLALASSATTWMMGADRAQAVAGFDGAAPRWLGTFSERWGTPIAVNLTSGAVATAVMVLALALSDGDGAKYFGAVLGLAISTTTISYLLVFPALVRLRHTLPDVPRPYRVPFGMAGAWVVSILTTAWAVFAVAGLIYPGLGTAHPDSALPRGFERLDFELTQIVPLVLLVVLGLAFYAAGRSTREQVVAVEADGALPLAAPAS